MHRLNQNIELGSRPSNTQPNRQNMTPNPRPDTLQFNYLPQEDEMDDQESQLSLEQPHNPGLLAQDISFYSKLCRNKAANLTIILILCLSIIDLVPLYRLGYHFFNQGGFIGEIRNSRLKSLQAMSTHLKADPIMEIQIMDHGSACPSGFQPLKLANWPGTVAGCLCDNGDLHSTSCKKLRSPKCKTNIQRTLPIEMEIWDGSIFCAKRALLGADYLKKAECPEGYKECYPGGCFEGDCPITKLEITSTGPATNKFNNKEKYLLSTKTQGELPLVNVQITLGDIPCFTRSFFDQTLKNSSYDLSAVKGNGCDKYGLDSDFTTSLSSQTAYDSFTRNSFPSSVINLPFFEKNAKETVSVLSWTVRMKTAKNDYCLDLDGKPIQDYLRVANSPTTSFVIAVIVLTVQIITIVMILYPCSRNSGTKLFPNSDQFIRKIAKINVFPCILTARFSYSYLVEQKFMAMKGSFEEYEALGCFEGGQGSRVISDMMALLNEFECESAIFFICLVWICNFSYVLVFLCYFITKKRLIKTQ